MPLQANGPRKLSTLLALLLAWQPMTQAALGQEPAPQQTPKLNIVIVEGEGAINNIKQRTAREAIVQVEDENRKPVAGAAVTFLLPNQGAGGTFANGARSTTIFTNDRGQAIMRGLRPNNVAGNFTVNVSASYQGATASAVITQTNAIIAATAAGAAGAAISTKVLLTLIAVGGAAAAGGTIAATRGGGDSAASAPRPSTTISPGNPTVGPPR